MARCGAEEQVLKRRRRPWPLSTAKVHRIVEQILNKGEEETPEKKLLNSIEKVAKFAMEEIERMKKREERDQRVLSSGASMAEETVISNMSVAFDRMLLGVENLICVYSKKHMNDDPELVDMKRKANTRSLKEMATMLRSGGKLIWIALSCGRDRPDPSTGEWFPVEKEIGEKKLVGFHGTGLSVAPPEISFSDITADCENPNEAKEAYSQALYNLVNGQYKILTSAIKHRSGADASSSAVSLSQPWN